MRDDKKDDLVVFAIRSRDSMCSECGEEIPKGGFLKKEGERGLCMDCADLGDLEFLAAGDPALTRRASKYSPLRAVVVEWSRSRKRYERQGILVAPEAIERAEEECLADEDLRRVQQLREAVRREEIDRAYLKEFGRAVREQYPHLPAGLESAITRMRAGNTRAASAAVLLRRRSTRRRSTSPSARTSGTHRRTMTNF